MAAPRRPSTSSLVCAPIRSVSSVMYVLLIHRAVLPLMLNRYSSLLGRARNSFTAAASAGAAALLPGVAVELAVGVAQAQSSAAERRRAGIRMAAQYPHSRGPVKAAPRPGAILRRDAAAPEHPAEARGRRLRRPGPGGRHQRRGLRGGSLFAGRSGSADRPRRLRRPDQP